MSPARDTAANAAVSDFFPVSGSTPSTPYDAPDVAAHPAATHAPRKYTLACALRSRVASPASAFMRPASSARAARSAAMVSACASATAVIASISSRMARAASRAVTPGAPSPPRSSISSWFSSLSRADSASKRSFASRSASLSSRNAAASRSAASLAADMPARNEGEPSFKSPATDAKAVDSSGFFLRCSRTAAAATAVASRRALRSRSTSTRSLASSELCSSSTLRRLAQPPSGAAMNAACASRASRSFTRSQSLSCLTASLSSEVFRRFARISSTTVPKFLPSSKPTYSCRAASARASLVAVSAISARSRITSASYSARFSPCRTDASAAACASRRAFASASQGIAERDTTSTASPESAAEKKAKRYASSRVYS